MNFSNSPRVLLSAYHCAPELGSVSQIGWEWYWRLAKRLPVTLITHVRNHKHLIKFNTPLPQSEIIYIDTEWFAEPVFNFMSKLFPNTEYPVSLFSSIDFYLYDWLAVKALKQRQQQGDHWDIIHQVTPVSPKSATRLHHLQRPVVLGPWNGGLTVPLAFPEVILQDLNWLYPLRYLGNLIDWIWQSTPQAAMILTATQATLQSIPKRFHSRCHPFLENGVNLDLFTQASWPPAPSPTEPLRIVFVGRFLAFKGIPMLLKAIAEVHQIYPIQLIMVGSGPREHEWKKLAQQLQLSNIITWYGQATLAEVVTQLHQAHVLCLPSVRESGGAVLLEAMACARPVIAIQYGGPAEIVDDQVGCIISPQGGTKAVITALTHCLTDIFEHPDHWRQRGEEGRRRALNLYSWEKKIDNMLILYQQLIAEWASSHQRTT